MSAPSSPGGGGSAAGSALQVTVVARSDEEKRMSRFSDAILFVKSCRIPYAHDFTLLPRVDLGRLLRGADTDHLALWAAPGLVIGPLPETGAGTKEMLLRPWKRMQNYAEVCDFLRSVIVAGVHLMPPTSADPDDPPILVRRVALFSDPVVGRGGWDFDESLELCRVLGAMSAGLRALATRDPKVYSASFASSKLTSVHPVAGRVNWFVYLRSVLMDRFREWLEAVRDGGPLYSGGVDGSGAAAKAVDGAAITKDWPFAGLGEAILMAAGSQGHPAADAAWAAVEAHEALVAASFKVLSDGVASGSGAAAGAAVAGDYGVPHPPPGPKDRAGRQDPRDGAAQTGGKGSNAAVVAAARAALASKAVDTLTRADCLDAKLCFKCKFPTHDRPPKPGASDCTQRGMVMAAPNRRKTG